MEAGSYEKAIQDITSCLQTQTQCMDADNRFIAETHYQLGNAYLFNRDYTQAVEHLRKAKSVSANIYLTQFVLILFLSLNPAGQPQNFLTASAMCLLAFVFFRLSKLLQ